MSTSFLKLFYTVSIIKLAALGDLFILTYYILYQAINYLILPKYICIPTIYCLFRLITHSDTLG